MSQEEIKIPFNCYTHNFTTEEPEEYYKHIADIPHEKSGQFRCTGCNKISKYQKGKLIKEGYDVKGKPNLIPQNQLCAKCQEKDDDETIKRLKKEGKIQ